MPRYCRVAAARLVPHIFNRVLNKEEYACTCTMEGLCGKNWEHNYFTAQQIMDAEAAS